MNLKDVKAIVTGGASGMGRAFCLGLAAEGASVLIADVNSGGIQDTIDAGKDLPGTLAGCEANVTDEGSVKQLMATAVEKLGGLNALVNNAGIFRDALLVKVDRESGKVAKSMSLADWNAVIGVDLTGPFLCMREFISSVSRAGNAGQSNYSAAKAGLVADTKLWAQELARYGIRVGAIAPGFIQTPILDGMRPEMLEKMVKQVPLRRTGTPEEIFMGVKFILENGYFTGKCLDIDGGLVL